MSRRWIDIRIISRGKDTILDSPYLVTVRGASVRVITVVNSLVMLVVTKEVAAGSVFVSVTARDRSA